jgi:hypothetical protein
MSGMWSDDLVPSRSGASDSPAPGSPAAPGPPEPPRPSGPAAGEASASGRSSVVVGIVIVVLAGVLALPAASIAGGAKSFWPKTWDARIAPIAARDEKLRGLNYEHPVAVRFLADAAFKKLVGGSDSGPTAVDSVETKRQAALFRTLGFISGKVDLLKVEKQAGEAGILAFYDFDTKEITVRGTKIDVSLRATLAHELTHVLQDQHFDIRDIDKRAAIADAHTGGSSQAMLALIEGDADNVRDRYLKGLTAADRAEYVKEQAAEGAGFDKANAGVPPFVDLLFGAPYTFGPPTIQVLVAEGGNRAIDAALTGPIPTSADYVQAGLVAGPPSDLTPPSLASGETAVGKPESFGAFELYLMLATRGDANSALTAADAVEGGIARSLRAGGHDCYRATLELRDTNAANYVAGAIRTWEKTATDASVDRVGTSVTFTACDPGSSAAGPSAARLSAAENLLGGRAGITVGVAQNGLSGDEARCVGRLFARTPNAVSLLIQAGRGTLSPGDTAALQAQVRGEADTCRADPSSGLL